MDVIVCKKWRKRKIRKSRITSDETVWGGSACLSNPYLDLKLEEKGILNTLFDDIIEKISIDYTNQEIKELQSAIFKMLGRIKEKVNERGVFNISHIQPCGSMPEKTAIWKWDESAGQSYTEFDFLAVLKNSTEGIAGNECLGCLRVTKPPVNLECLKTLYTDIKDPLYSCINDIRVINNLFIQELLKSMTSDCHCLSPEFKDSSHDGLYRKFSITGSGQYETVCDKCSVRMPTGTLRVNTNVTIDINTAPMNCSLVFLWESKTESLMAPVDVSLNQIEPVITLTIYVDFIPALQFFKLGSSDDVLKLEHDRFIVPKRCAWRNTCENRGVDGAWRMSSCLLEMNAMLKLDNRLRKCYQIVKFLCQTMARSYKFGFYPVNRYHVKTIALNHSRTCSDSQSKGCADCVVGILYELQTAYESEDHDAFKRGASESDTWNSSMPSLFHGGGVPEFEGTRFRNLIASLCLASKSESTEVFLKNVVSFAS